MTAPFRTLFERVTDIYESAPDHVRRELGMVFGSVILLTAAVGLLLEFT
jgi:hypothetical protein